MTNRVFAPHGLTSTIVMKRVVDERPFPVSPHSPGPQRKG
jgi:hypothetical protein